MDFKGVLTNPYVIGGGVLIGLLLLSRSGGSAGSMAGVTLQSQALASETNIQLASIQAQRDSAMAAMQTEMALGKMQLAALSLENMTTQFVAGLQHGAVQSEISANLLATQQANVIGAQVAMASIANEANALNVSRDIQMQALATQADIARGEMGLAAHEINVMGGLGHAELAFRREVEAPMMIHALNLESQLRQAELPVQAALISENAHLAALVQNNQIAAQEHAALMQFQAHKNELKGKRGFGGFLNSIGSAFGQSFGSVAGARLGSYV